MSQDQIKLYSNFKTTGAALPETDNMSIPTGRLIIFPNIHKSEIKNQTKITYVQVYHILDELFHHPMEEESGK